MEPPLVGIGALLFGTGNQVAANAAGFCKARAVFSRWSERLPSPAKNFPASRAATLIGATQMFGMAGGSAGQSVVGPMIAGGLAWNHFWVGMGIAGLVISVLLFVFLPTGADSQSGWLEERIRSFGGVFKNPQSILCGMIAGLLFIPTTIFDMIWGVRFLQEAHGFDYASAVMRSSTCPWAGSSAARCWGCFQIGWGAESL